MAGGLGKAAAQVKASAASGFAHMKQGHQKMTGDTARDAAKTFEKQVTALAQLFEKVSSSLKTALDGGIEAIESGLRGALVTLDPAIDKAAKEAADQVQPRWKTVLKVLIVIAIVVVVLVVMPYAIAGVGFLAGALGASAGVAGVIGTVVGGAIVGAGASLLTQVGTNLVDGKPAFEGWQHALIQGAIFGAVGGAGGALGTAMSEGGAVLGGLAVRVGSNILGAFTGDVGADLAVNKNHDVNWKGAMFDSLVAGGLALGGEGLMAGVKSARARFGSEPEPGKVGAGGKGGPELETGAAGKGAPDPKIKEQIERSTGVDKGAEYEAAQQKLRDYFGSMAKNAEEAVAASKKPTPSVKEQAERSTGVDKGPDYALEQQKLKDFYKQMEKEAQNLKVADHARTDPMRDVASGQPLTDANGNPYGWEIKAGFEVQEFSHGLTNIKVKIHLEPGQGVTDADLAMVRAKTAEGIDQYYNGPKNTLPNGNRLHVEVEFVTDPNLANMKVEVKAGSGHTNQKEWYLNDDAHATTYAHEFGHQLGLPDRYVDEASLLRYDEILGYVDNDSLMGNYWREDPNNPGRIIADPNAHLTAKDLQDLQDAIDKAFKAKFGAKGPNGGTSPPVPRGEVPRAPEYQDPLETPAAKKAREQRGPDQVAKIDGHEVRGFKSPGEVVERLGNLKNRAVQCGFDDVQVGIRGSSVTGESSKGGGFRWDGDYSDVDFLVSSAKLDRALARYEARYGDIQINGRIRPDALPRFDPELSAILDEFAAQTKQQLGRKASALVITQALLRSLDRAEYVILH
jgi:hypothetical protein